MRPMCARMDPFQRERKGEQHKGEGGEDGRGSKWKEEERPKKERKHPDVASGRRREKLSRFCFFVCRKAKLMVRRPLKRAENAYE